MVAQPPVVLYESSWDSERAVDGTIIVAVHFRRKKTAERFLDHRLTLARTDPAALAKLVEQECLTGLSGLMRDPGAEHSKNTRRQSGGGTLTKGS